MGCCQYCMYGSSGSGSKTYVTTTDCKNKIQGLHQEMSHMKVDDLAQQELIEELQQKLTILQKCVYDLIQYISVSTCGHCGFTALVPNGTKPSIAENPNLLDFSIYQRYLIGDYDQEGKVNKGYQSEGDLKSRTGVVPAAMQSPVDHLPSPSEDDRVQDKINVQKMFVNIGSETGSAESELAEFYAMIEAGDESALEALRLMYYQNAKGLSASSMDTMEEDDES